MYSLAGYDVSDDEFDVTPMVALDDTDLGITEPKQQNNNKQDGIISPGEVDNTVEAIDYETLEEETIDERQNERVRIFIAIYSYDPITMSPNTEYNSEELSFKKDDLIQIIGEMGEDGFYFGKIDGKSGYVPSNLVAEINLDDNTIIDSSVDENLDQINDTKNKSDSFDLSHMLKPSKVHSDEEDENPGLLSELNKSLSNSVPILSSSNQHEDDKTTNNENLPTAYSLPELQNSSEDESGRDSGRKRADPYKLKPRLMVALFNYDPAVSSPNVDSEIELSFAAGEKIEVYGEMDEDGFFSGKLNGRKGLIPSNFVSDRKEESKTSMAISSSQESLETKNKKKKKNLFKSMSKAISKFKSK
ncbi:RIMS-binding protein 2-like [Clytia hemisphaerica]|uniref:SH3 domain-containing protein n=1 Tax=Clytia hemisphaerica TaxID=252671 RepID=A0A7M5XK30_9CNID